MQTCGDVKKNLIAFEFACGSAKGTINTPAFIGKVPSIAPFGGQIEPVDVDRTFGFKAKKKYGVDGRCRQ
jgi:hypothetical protein